MQDRDREELVTLRLRFGQLKEEARRNEDTWRRAQQREMALLDAEGLPALLVQLTEGLRSSHQLEATGVTLLDPDREIRHLLAHGAPLDASTGRVAFVDTPRELPLALRARARPWLGPFVAADHAALFAAADGLASVALLPLLRHGALVGSLQFGSRHASRFTAAHGSDFLHHLAVIAAFCLENAVNQAKLVRVGSTDLLTGWHNRRYLEERLHEEVARAERERRSLVCVMIDVDHFKRINDAHGHLVGDEVLREVARRIGRQVRHSDVSARYGGEEFIVVLPGTELTTGHRLAERIRAAVSAEPIRIASPDLALTVTVSIGLSQFSPGERTEDPRRLEAALIAGADAALYEAKAAGRNAVVLARAAS